MGPVSAVGLSLFGIGGTFDFFDPTFLCTTDGFTGILDEIES
mgnify:CR=1 FL=1